MTAKPTYNSLHDPDDAKLKAAYIERAERERLEQKAVAVYEKLKDRPALLDALLAFVEAFDPTKAVDERRIAIVSRRAARIVRQLELAGDRDAARRFEAAAIKAIDEMRRGAR